MIVNILKLKILAKPADMSYIKLLGISFLAAIGFTMSLFVTELAFDAQLHPEFPDQAKLGIIVASLIGGISGFDFKSI